MRNMLSRNIARVPVTTGRDGGGRASSAQCQAQPPDRHRRQGQRAMGGRKSADRFEGRGVSACAQPLRTKSCRLLLPLHHEPLVNGRRPRHRLRRRANAAAGAPRQRQRQTALASAGDEGSSGERVRQYPFSSSGTAVKRVLGFGSEEKPAPRAARPSRPAQLLPLFPPPRRQYRDRSPRPTAVAATDLRRDPPRPEPAAAQRAQKTRGCEAERAKTRTAEADRRRPCRRAHSAPMAAC